MKLNLPAPLDKQYVEEHEKLSELVRNFPWESKLCYSQYLGQSYFYARESTRILALASGSFELNQTDLHYRFLDHAREEKGHEVLLIKDLKNLGVDISDVVEMPEMSAFYHNLYYWIEHQDPIALFGWVLNLEGFALEDGKYIYDEVVKYHGKKCANFLNVHANEDEEHVASALKFFHKLNENQIQMISKNFSECSCLFYNIMDKIKNMEEAERNISLHLVS